MNPTEKIHTIFPSFEIELNHQISTVAVIKHVSSGEILMKTGQHFKNVMLVMDGSVKVYREDDDGNEFFMYYLESGQACALSMICAARFQVSQLMAKAETEVTLLTIPLKYMDEWMSKYKTWYYFVLENYRSRFDEVLKTLDHVAFRNMDQRLIYYLKRYKDMHKTNLVKISITEIAQELNSSREVISRLLKKLNEKGVVISRKDHIELVNLDKLIE